MPWSIQKRMMDGKQMHCVVKKSDGSTEKCHPSAAQAKKHMAALYASEKELDETDEKAASGAEDAEVKMYGGDMPHSYVPYGVTTFSELKAAREADEASMEMSSMAGDLQSLLGNRISMIMMDEAVGDKSAAIVASLKELAGELAGEVEAEAADEGMETMELADPEAGLFQRFKDWLKSTTTKAADGEKRPAPSDTPGFMLWKQADGTYRWLARYSNNFRDQDNPPEIIAAQSHRRFVDLVDKGQANMPELWLWHRPEWKWGVADWLAYDDAGFALAAGVVDHGKETLAETIMSLGPEMVRVSHGMPTKSIARDAGDSSVIVEHETREISPLPAWAAANQLTGFTILKEVQDMAIPEEKRQSLIKDWNLSPELLSEIEAANSADAKEADAAGIERKEVEGQEVATGVATETVAEPPTEAPLVRAEVADAMLAITGLIDQLRASVEALSGEVKALKETDAQKIADKAAATPAASLVDLVRGGRAVGSEATRIDGRTSLARSGPAETKEAPVPISAIPFLNQLVAPPQQ